MPTVCAGVSMVTRCTETAPVETLSVSATPRGMRALGRSEATVDTVPAILAPTDTRLVETMTAADHRAAR